LVSVVAHPAVARVLAGIRRAYGTRQAAKTATLTDDLRRVVRALPTTTLAGIPTWRPSPS